MAEVEDTPPPPSAPVRSASTKPAARSRPARPAPAVPSLISADMVIRGAIESEGEVQFDGEIEGDIRAHGLVIGEGARVAGEVIADKVRVAGTVEGAIRAARVELAATALVEGDVIHTALAIEAGARFEGSVRHSDDPAGQCALPPAPRAVAAPTPPARGEMAHEPARSLPSGEPIGRTAPRRAKPDLR